MGKINVITSKEFLAGKKLPRPKFTIGQVVYVSWLRRYARVKASGVWPNGDHCYEPGYTIEGEEGQGITRFERGLMASNAQGEGRVSGGTFVL